jgi:hypothetical protein
MGQSLPPLPPLPPCYEHGLLELGGAALAHTGLSFVPNGLASSSFLLWI